MPGHSPRIAPEHDLEAARRLLAEAGYPDGRGLPELVLAVPSWLLPANGFVEQWEAIGARVRVVDGGKLWSIPKPAHLWVSGWTADHPDPDGFFRGLFRLGLPFYLDAEITELLEQARSLTDQGERMRLYHELDRVLVADRVGFLPISYGRSMLVRRTWVDGLWANPLSKANFDEAVVRRSAPRSA
jgi:ABC-type transport system substrate-binding protein